MRDKKKKEYRVKLGFEGLKLGSGNKNTDTTHWFATVLSIIQKAGIEGEEIDPLQVHLNCYEMCWKFSEQGNF